MCKTEVKKQGCEGKGDVGQTGGDGGSVDSDAGDEQEVQGNGYNA